MHRKYILKNVVVRERFAEQHHGLRVEPANRREPASELPAPLVRPLVPARLVIVDCEGAPSPRIAEASLEVRIAQDSRDRRRL
jgi:hypothetical protein